MTAGELAARVPEGTSVHALNEGVEMVGPDVDAWLCGNFGLMSPSST